MGKYCTARQATDDNIIWSLRTEEWKPKATNKHSEYVIFSLVKATMVARTRLNVTLYVHCLSRF